MNHLYLVTFFLISVFPVMEYFQYKGCLNYKEITGKEVKYYFADTCYVKYRGAWHSKEEHEKTVMILGIMGKRYEDQRSNITLSK